METALLDPLVTVTFPLGVTDPWLSEDTVNLKTGVWDPADEVPVFTGEERTVPGESCPFPVVPPFKVPESWRDPEVTMTGTVPVPVFLMVPDIRIRVPPAPIVPALLESWTVPAVNVSTPEEVLFPVRVIEPDPVLARVPEERIRGPPEPTKPAVPVSWMFPEVTVSTPERGLFPASVIVPCPVFSSAPQLSRSVPSVPIGSALPESWSIPAGFAEITPEYVLVPTSVSWAPGEIRRVPPVICVPEFPESWRPPEMPVTKPERASFPASMMVPAPVTSDGSMTGGGTKKEGETAVPTAIEASA